MDLDNTGYGYLGEPFQFLVGARRLEGLDAFRAETTEKHAMVLGLTAFAAPVAIPSPAFPARVPPDLRLAPGSPAADAGQPLPNVNDGYSGKAPDLGAYELGVELPIYGPRPMGSD
jgi:hypothetical protein